MSPRLDGIDDAIAWLQKQNAELVQLMSDLGSGLSSVEEVVALQWKQRVQFFRLN